MNKLKRLFVGAMALAMAVTAVAATYTNPVIRRSCPDPMCFRDTDGTYYLYSTEDTHNGPIFRSYDLVNWEQIGTAFTDQTRPSCLNGAGLWAPEVAKVGNKYLYYFSIGKWGDHWNSGIGVAYGDSPAGPFYARDDGKLFLASEIGVQNSIDQFYFEENGHKYLFWGSFFGIYGVELSDDGMSVKAGAQKKKIAGSYTEGTNIIKHGGYYYLLGSGGSCCEGAKSTYHVVVARSTSLWGPYVNQYGSQALDNWYKMLMEGNSVVKGPGHNSVFVQDDNGDYWMLYHGYMANDPDRGRQVFLDKINWVDGWPTVANKQPSTTAVTAPVCNNPRVSVSTREVSFSCDKDQHPYKDITVSTAHVNENVSIWADSEADFSLSTKSLGSGGGTFRITFTGSDWYLYKETWVHVRANGVQQDIHVTGDVKGAVLPELSEGWNLSDRRGTKSSKGYNANEIRNFCYLDGKLYCVYQNKKIIVLHSQTGELLGELKTTGIGEGTLALTDVKAVSGKIVACNLATVSQNNHFRIYLWDSDDAEPKTILNTTDFQGVDRIGDCMEVVGTLNSDAWFCFMRDTGTETRIVEYHQTGEYDFTPKYTKAFNEKGTRLTSGATSRAYPKSGNYWVDGNGINPTWMTRDRGYDGVATWVVNNLDGQTQGASHHEFYYHGWKYAANLVFRGSANYTSAKMRILRDRAGNFTNNDEQREYPGDGLGDVANKNGTGDVIVRTNEVDYAEAWVLCTEQGLAYYRTGNVPAANPDPVNKPVISFSERDVDLRAKVGQPTTKTLYVNGKGLSGGIDIAVAGCPEGRQSLARYTVSPTHLDGPGEITVTYTPAEYDYDWVWLSANSAGAETAWTDIHGRGYKDPTLNVTGDANFDTYVGESTQHTFQVQALDMKGWLASGLWGDNTDQFSHYNSWGLTDNTTVYFQNSRAKWSDVYIYVWDMTDHTHYCGDWPGTRLEPAADGTCTFTFNPADKSHDYGILFHNNAGTQTDDGIVVNGSWYAAAEGTLADRVKGGINGEYVRMPLMAWHNGTLTITHTPTAEGYKESNFFVSTQTIPQNFDVVLRANGKYHQRIYPELSEVNFGQGWINLDNKATVRFTTEHQTTPANIYIDGADARCFRAAVDNVLGNSNVDLYYRPDGKATHRATLHAEIPGEHHSRVELVGWSDGMSGVDGVESDGLMTVTRIGSTLRVGGVQPRAIRVYDVTGILVAASDNAATCAIGHLPAGTYIVTVTDSRTTRRLKLRL